MKKILPTLSITLILLITSFALALEPYNDPGETGSGGSGSTVHYKRYDIQCSPQSDREKTRCETGGDELCTPRYCN